MNFSDSFAKLIDPLHEGGYSDDPHDPGGPTYLGISRVHNPNWPGWALIDKHRADPDFPKSLRLDTELTALASTFYQATYWMPAGCGAVPEILAFDLFDMSVNQGIATAVRALQTAAGATVDGVLGAATLAAVKSVLPMRLLFRFESARLARYAENSDQQLLNYGRGWLHRVGTNMVSA